MAPEPARSPAGSPSEPPAGASGGPAGSGGAAEGFDVVVLAGGTARRLSGASKPNAMARGARLLDHVLSGLGSLDGLGSPGGPARICVVAPTDVALPDGILRALEDPPLGGPVAGIAAGLERLARPAPAGQPAGGPAPLTAVMTCDAPESWRVLPALAELMAAPGGHEGAVVRHGDHVQYLLGLYRTGALARAVAPGGRPLRDTAVRHALGGLDVRVLAWPGAAAADLDTWEEIRAWDTLPNP